ncbi:hypothetical protein KEM48_014190, partial [Puccinia striiformis f. sp. tritici PST-130]
MSFTILGLVSGCFNLKDSIQDNQPGRSLNRWTRLTGSTSPLTPTFRNWNNLPERLRGLAGIWSGNEFDNRVDTVLSWNNDRPLSFNRIIDILTSSQQRVNDRLGDQRQEVAPVAFNVQPVNQIGPTQ